jgi:TPR repeat protein
MDLESVVPDPTLEKPEYIRLPIGDLLRRKDEPEAQYNLGYRMRNGIGGYDLKEGWKLTLASAMRGHPVALAVCLDSDRALKVGQRNNPKAIEIYRASAERGHGAAQNGLGYCLQSGERIPISHEQAVYWYERASEQGFPSAIRNLGLCYADGNGVEKDEAKAFQLYSKAAELQLPDAEINLGYLHSNGIGTPRNAVESARLYKSAALKGEGSYSLNNLATCYHRGTGVIQDKTIAGCLYKLAILRQHSDAPRNLLLLNLTQHETRLIDACIDEAPSIETESSLDELVESHSEVVPILMVYRKRAFKNARIVQQILPIPIADEILPHIIA